MLRLQIAFTGHLRHLHTRLEERTRCRGDAGEISSTVIIIAVLSALAIAVGIIIAAKVTQKAESIPTG